MYPQNIDLPQTTPNFPKAKPQPTSSITAATLHLRVHYHVDNEHQLHQPALRMCHPHKHNTHHHTHTNNTPPSKTDLNRPSQFSITEEDQQRVPKSADGTKVKRSKQQTRQPDEHLCFHCNLPGHLQHNCPELPYCSRCRTRGHTPDRCMNKTQKTRCTHPAGEPRDQQKRRDDLPQFSGSRNKCLQCGGDHHTTSCMR